MPPRHSDMPHWQGRFRRCGLRFTAAREAVLTVLKNTSEHLSAEDIYMRAHRINANVGLATIYRTLDALVELGIVSKHDFGQGHARYELITRRGQTESHHHHLVCTECGRIIDYDDFLDEEQELAKKTEKRLSRKFNFKITDHSFQFNGICHVCQKK